MPDQTHEPVEAAAAETSHIADAEKVARDLRKLLDGCESARLKSEVKAQIEDLVAWADSYVEGVSAARNMNESGLVALYAAREELTLCLDEYLRLESEGGNPATAEQQRRTDEVSRAFRRVNMLIPVFSATLAEADPPEPEPEIQPDQPNQPEIPEQPLEPDYVPDQPDIPPVTQPEMRLHRHADAA